MKVQLESTARVVTIVVNGAEVPARIWEGKTDSGIPVIALITRIAVPEGQDQTQFQRELQEHAPPSVQAVEAIPLRFFID